MQLRRGGCYCGGEQVEEDGSKGRGESSEGCDEAIEACLRSCEPVSL